MKILVLQHARTENPGIFRKFLCEDGHEYVPVQLDEGETPPSIDEFDALWVMGGPMDAWQESRYSWLRREIEFIRDAVEVRGVPFLGIGLGHQLLAMALGGECARAKLPEIGVMSVQLTEIGATGVIFDDLPDIFSCLQWHNSEVAKMPSGASCLATSPNCAVQAMSWGPRAYSMQFHVEIEAETIANLIATPAHKSALDAALGEDGISTFKVQCDNQMVALNTIGERVYINWLQTAAQI